MIFLAVNHTAPQPDMEVVRYAVSPFQHKMADKTTYVDMYVGMYLPSFLSETTLKITINPPNLIS